MFFQYGVQVFYLCVSSLFFLLLLSFCKGMLLWRARDHSQGIRREDQGLSLKFRCYVHNKKLCAISQYHVYCSFQELQKEELVEKIRFQAFFFFAVLLLCLSGLASLTCTRKTSPLIPLPSYVIDVAYVAEEDKCVIIELNPHGSRCVLSIWLFARRCFECCNLHDVLSLCLSLLLILSVQHELRQRPVLVEEGREPPEREGEQGSHEDIEGALGRGDRPPGLVTPGKKKKKCVSSSFRPQNSSKNHPNHERLLF